MKLLGYMLAAMNFIIAAVNYMERNIPETNMFLIIGAIIYFMTGEDK